MIAGGYFLFCRERVRDSMKLYQALFPGRGRVFCLYCVWRQFADFASSYCDRLSLETGEKVEFVEEGREHLENALLGGTGGIILISHLGNWEIIARIAKRKGVKLLLLMGEQESKQVSRMQKEDMRAEGINVVVPSPAIESRFAGLEAVEFLKGGGLVAIAGDLGWKNSNRGVMVNLFGRKAVLPAAPHLLGLYSGAPLFTLFAYRISRNKYLVSISPPRWVEDPIKGRNVAIQESAQKYARDLEKAVRRFPYQWHVFEPLFVADPERKRGK